MSELWCPDRRDLPSWLGCSPGARWCPSPAARWWPSLGAQIGAICFRASGACLVPAGGRARWCASLGARRCSSFGAQIVAIRHRGSSARLVLAGGRALVPRAPRFASVARSPAWCSLVPEPWRPLVPEPWCPDRRDLPSQLGCPVVPEPWCPLVPEPANQILVWGRRWYNFFKQTKRSPFFDLAQI